MDLSGDEGSVSFSPPSPPRNLRARPPPSWVPCAGTKRKAHVANLGDHFDVDCRPSPAKQFAVDEEVAPVILRDGFYFDPAIPTPPPSAPMNEVEMDEAPTTSTDAVEPGGYIKGIGDPSTKCLDVEKGGCDDPGVVKPHSLHESQPVSDSRECLSFETSSLNGVTLFLSNEIQETLTQRKLNGDFILPKEIIERVSGSDMSMALVPWKPPTNVDNFIAQSQKKEERSLAKKRGWNQQNLKSAYSSIPVQIGNSFKRLPAAAEEEELLEGMEVDS